VYKEIIEMKAKLVVVLLIVALAVPFGVTQARQETVTIKFWHTHNPTENQMLTETLIPMFEASHPNIKVESVIFPYDAFRQTLLTSLAGGEGPDLARLDIIWSPEFAKLGVLSALDEVMPDFQQFADAVFAGPLSTNFYDGHYWGLPLDTNTRIFWWNSTLYKEAGIEGPPATIDDLKAQCEPIKALGDDKFVFVDGGTYGWAVLPWIWSFGGDITDPEITKASGYLNGEKTVAAYQFLADMVKSGCFSPGFLGGVDTAAGFFGNLFASMLEGPWWFPMAEAQYPDFEIRTALMPAGEGGSISVVGGENAVLFSGSQHPEEAMEFLRFMQSDEYQLKMAETGQLTVVSALVENDYFKNHPYYPLYLEQLKTAKARTPHPAWSEMESILTDAGQLILRGEASPQEALDSAAEDIDALLAEE
jgi:multiple sugar transport system substrate-binding protein